eukprot:c18453_g2_i1.p1 GENE.c18453_g2_i1~~c18453_g2_i1.p1  ORF type:complete len:340 (+),score=94.67 c18453_g2_i1:147-1166(+)
MEQNARQILTLCDDLQIDSCLQALLADLLYQADPSEELQHERDRLVIDFAKSLHPAKWQTKARLIHSCTHPNSQSLQEIEEIFEDVLATMAGDDQEFSKLHKAYDLYLPHKNKEDLFQDFGRSKLDIGQTLPFFYWISQSVIDIDVQASQLYAWQQQCEIVWSKETQKAVVDASTELILRIESSNLSDLNEAKFFEQPLAPWAHRIPQLHVTHDYYNLKQMVQQLRLNMDTPEELLLRVKCVERIVALFHLRLFWPVNIQVQLLDAANTVLCHPELQLPHNMCVMLIQQANNTQNDWNCNFVNPADRRSLVTNTPINPNDVRPRFRTTISAAVANSIIR